jgi:hypothetical protein
MDFTNRGQNNGAQRRTTAFSPVGSDDDGPAVKDGGDSRSPRIHLPTGGNDSGKLFRVAGGVLIIIIALLIASALALFIFSKPASESRLVDTGKLQAVFLTNDQVYFGKITSINKQYVVLGNIYYLQSSNASSKDTSGQISLIKLGCELHRPQDRMVISQQQVSFWENLESDGQVAKLVQKYQDANPNGQKCSDAATGTNPVQGSSTPAKTTPSPTTNTGTNGN